MVRSKKEVTKTVRKPSKKTAKSVVKNAVAIPGVDDESRFPILGSLVWYSLRDVRITRGVLGGMYDRHGIDRRHMPAEISPANAFRRAATRVHTDQTQAAKQDLDGTTKVVMIRHVANNEREIVKHIIAERRDSENKRLSYEQVGTLIFDKDLAEMRGTALSEYRYIVERTESYYSDMCEFYNGTHIRNSVHRILSDTHPVNVRPAGGVFFVSQEYSSVIEALTGFVEDTNTFGVTGTDEAIFEAIPLLDVEKQRKMIFAKYENQCEISVDKTLEELAHLLKSTESPTKETLGIKVNAVKHLKTGIESYEKLLARDMIKGRQKLGLLQEQVNALLNKASVSHLKTENKEAANDK